MEKTSNGTPAIPVPARVQAQLPARAPEEARKALPQFPELAELGWIEGNRVLPCPRVVGRGASRPGFHLGLDLLAAILHRWGGPSVCDFSNDGNIHGADLAVLLAGWTVHP